MQLPRALNIAAFVEARRPELATLLSGLTVVKGSNGFGDAALPRHLRRRATSHNRRARLRRPNVRLALLYKRRKVSPEADNAASAIQDASTGTTLASRPTNRQMRRRPARVWEKHVFSRCPELHLPSQQNGLDHGGDELHNASVSNAIVDNQHKTMELHSTVKHLETHLWHARRMQMYGPLWGHMLPLHAAGKGRGSRSFLHHLRSQCVMHDANYWGCLQLTGHQKHLASILRLCCDPRDLDVQMNKAEVICGAVEWPLDLYECNSFPSGALAPVKAIWVPADQALEPGQDNMAAEPDINAATTGSSGHSVASDIQQQDEGWYPHCSLWLWVHAAAFQDCAEALMEARAQLSLQGSVSICNMSAALRRIEVVGSGCDTVLHHVVRPCISQVNTINGSGINGNDQIAGSIGSYVWNAVGSTLGPSTSEMAASKRGQRRKKDIPLKAVRDPSQVAPHSKQVHSAGTDSKEGIPKPPRMPGHEPWIWPDGCVIGVTAADPRLAAPVKVGGHLVTLLACQPQQQASVTSLRPMLKRWPDSGDWTDGAHLLLRSSCASPTSQGSAPDIQSEQPSMSSTTMYPLPISEAGISMLRQQARHQALQLPVEPASSSAASKTQAGAKECPVLLVRQKYGRLPGWSIIFPAGWVNAYWKALAFAGVRAAGQQEWRWVMSQAGKPCFPWDYPHTSAWQRTATQIAEVQAAWATRRPPGCIPEPTFTFPYIPWKQLGCEARDAGRPPPALSHQRLGIVLKPQEDHVAVAVTNKVAIQPAIMNTGTWKSNRKASHKSVEYSVMQPRHAEGRYIGSKQDFVQLLVGQQLPERQVVNNQVLMQGNVGMPHTRRCLVWAMVRVLRRGNCMEGAEVSWQANCNTRTDTTSLVSGQSSSLEEQANKSRVILGYVTTSHVPGMQISSASQLATGIRVTYPGGLAVVCAGSFAQAMQRQCSGHDVRKFLKSGLVVQISNPNSNTPWTAVLHVLF